MNAPMLEMNARPTRQEMGKIGEKYAAYLFQCSGYIPLPHRRLMGDLGVIDLLTGEIRNIEVKAARRRPDGKYVFQLKNHHQDCQRADYLVLLAVLKSGVPVVFVIPTEECKNRATLVITSDPRKYRGKWSVYRQPTGMVTL